MDNVLLGNIFVFLLATILAILEIQVEGKQRVGENKKPAPYQTTMFILVFLMFSLPYFFGKTLTLVNYTETVSLFFIFIVLWDFLWFVLNPAYPLKNFKQEHVWWHKTWLFGLPVSYFWSLSISLVLLFPVMVFTHNADLFHFWLTNMILFIMETCLMILFTLDVMKIDNWHHRSHKSFKSFRGN
jgi:hypothetical protein